MSSIDKFRLGQHLRSVSLVWYEVLCVEFVKGNVTTDSFHGGL